MLSASSTHFESVLQKWLDAPRNDFERDLSDHHPEYAKSFIPGDLACRFLDTRILLKHLGLSDASRKDIEESLGCVADDMLVERWFDYERRRANGENVGNMAMTQFSHSIASVAMRRIQQCSIDPVVNLPDPEPDAQLQRSTVPPLKRVVDLDDLNNVVDNEERLARRRDFYRLIGNTQVSAVQKYCKQPLQRLLGTSIFLDLIVQEISTSATTGKRRGRKRRM